MKSFLCLCAVVLSAAGCGSRGAPRQNVIINEPSWAARFGTAKGIQEPGERDEALNSLALDAASDGHPDDVKKAIAEIRTVGKKDQAAHGASITLAKKGHAEAAKEVANGIADEGLREETLKMIAGFK